METHSGLTLPNGESEEISKVPVLATADFRRFVVRSVEEGAGLSALFVFPESVCLDPHVGEGVFRLFAVLSDASDGVLRVASTRSGGEYPALTPECPAAHLFEREIAEQWGVRPQGHPWMKSVRFPRSARNVETGKGSPGRADPIRGPGGLAAGSHAADEEPSCGDAPFFRVEGEEIHEVAVGPVHAGVIEPGHFRFQCHGEKVLHLEISLGYQHRDVERSLCGGSDTRTIHYAETLAGDTTIGHAIAYCQALESLGGCSVPPRAHALRGIALELERVANHIGDLGALAGDVGFLPTASWCGRIRGDVLNLTAMMCGSRFGRGLVEPGGTRFDLDEKTAGDISDRLAGVLKDARDACDLLWKEPSVVARFEETGVLEPETARGIGLVGPAARACGIERDIRNDMPAGVYRFSHIPVSSWRTGDVFARAFVRWLEVQRSAAFIAEQLRSLPSGETRARVPKPAPMRMAVSLVEGWRGEICHVAFTDSAGRFGGYKVVDPSFHNWFGLSLAMRGGQISDFPLCNKSFNLSYCGHDL